MRGGLPWLWVVALCACRGSAVDVELVATPAFTAARLELEVRDGAKAPARQVFVADGGLPLPQSVRLLIDGPRLEVIGTATTPDGQLRARTGALEALSAGSLAKLTLDFSQGPVPLNTLFVTSETFTGDLGGLPGADTRCAAIAADAGLPGTFLALLGTQATPVLSRLGEATGFSTVDGKAFAQTPSDFAEGRVRRLPLTERGAPVNIGNGAGVEVHTGKWRSIDTDCVGWTSAAAADRGGRGSAVLSGTFILSGFEFPCDIPGRLYCVSTAQRATLPPTPVPAGGRLAFVTGGRLSGASSLRDADALCAREGGPRALALRSLPDGGASGARLRADAGAFYRPDGELLFAPGSFSTLVPFNVQADGGYTDSNAAWVGAAPDRLTSLANSCNNWSPNPGDRGLSGSPISVELTWANSLLPCAEPLQVYCVEP